MSNHFDEHKTAPNVKIIPPDPKLIRKNVAIYCRVSTADKAQLKSLAAQISGLTRMVSSIEHWNLVDTYVDVASAKARSPREQFERMIKDCEAKGIQVILTKSISRFGRDSVDALDALRRLKAVGTRVIFQQENLDTADGDSAFMISILEAYAQEENETRSQNIRMGLKARASSGDSRLYSRKCYGYSKDDKGNLVINEKEAAVVQAIFNWYLQGDSVLGILKKLEDNHIPSSTGNEKWCKRSVDKILSNEKYKGDVRLHNSLDKKSDFMMYDGCPSIVTKETFQAVQEEKERRCNVTCDENGVHRKNKKYSSKRKESNNAMMNLDYIKDHKQMEFAIFCIENTAARLNVDAEKMYETLAIKSNILQNYIVPNYETLHTQGKDYIVDDILDVMKEKGVAV